MPIAQPDTQAALKSSPGTHRGKCDALGLDWSWRATIGRILAGQQAISLPTENVVRSRLGLPPIPPPAVPMLPCPSCAEKGIFRTHAHDLDCHGEPDAVAVMVKPSAQQAIALIDQWLADESGHDEAVWPVIEKALRNRSRAAEPARKRPPVRRPWMGEELTAEMDNAGVTDATVRWLVTRHIYEQELAGPVPALEV